MSDSLEVKVAKSLPIFSDEILKRLPSYRDRLDPNIDPDADVWDCLKYEKRCQSLTSNIYFGKIPHHELRAVAKVFAMHQLIELKNGLVTIRGMNSACQHLSTVLGSRPLKALNTGDFFTSEKRMIADKGMTQSSARHASHLAAFSRWLNENLGLILDYQPAFRPRSDFGQLATDSERSLKLIPDEVIGQILSLNAKHDMALRDRFFLSAFTISVATGLRSIELMTLPFDCLLNDGSSLMLRVLPAKKGVMAPRVVPPEFSEMVETSVRFLIDVTDGARKLIGQIKRDQPTDWSKVHRLQSQQEVEYFARRLFGRFIQDEQNRMLDSEMAFLQGNLNPRWPDRWVPIMKSFRECHGNVSKMSRELEISRFGIYKLLKQVAAAKKGEIYKETKTGAVRRSWDTDPRVVSMTVYQKLVGRIAFTSPVAKRAATFRTIRRVCDEAQAAQIANKVHSFVVPNYDAEIEARCARETAILKDPTSGDTLLNAEEALFVTFKNQLSENQKTVASRFRHVNTSDFSRWLNGYSRDLGSGKETDSIFSRFDIRDPRTDETARFTHHDIRHWLETSFHNGGLTELQIATFFNRKTAGSNSTYNQTSMKDRARRLRQVVGENMVYGHVATAHSKLAKEDPIQAARYLAAATKFYNPMPHGICLMNMASEPCPHALSCFNCGGEAEEQPGICENLVVDPRDQKQVQEIELINQNASSLKRFFEDEGETDGPQYVHHCSVELTTSQILKKVRSLENEIN